MLCELRVSQLGVIEELSLVLGPGMTALTGETGAGKTLVVEAVELLVGGRAEGMLVRPGAAEAVVEGRFVAADDDAELVLSRVVPADGRSRAYIDGRMAGATALAEVGARLVDLHGQHAHQSLFSPGAQRDALDAYANADREPRVVARAELRRIEQALAESGGDVAARQREVQLLEFQLAELDSAALAGPDEEDQLAAEEDRLVRAASHRSAAEAAYEGLVGEEQVLDHLGRIVSSLSAHPPLSELRERLGGLLAELGDSAGDARQAAETLEEDPQRLAEVVARRAVLRDLRRKYGRQGAGLEAVIEFASEGHRRLADLEGQEGVAARLAAERARATAGLRRACEELGGSRRAAAASFGTAVESELRRLAMPRARFEVRVGGPEALGTAAPTAGAGPRGSAVQAPTERAAPDRAGPEDWDEAEVRELSGDDVTFLFAANPGEPLLPLAKVASGGEVARAMLALRLVLLDSAAGVGLASPDDPKTGAGPTTLVFDEVDAGIGGEAALAVGRALAELGRRYQVIVVTHLAQVAAFAGSQVTVTKVDRGGRSIALATVVEGKARVIELSRMLSGQPDSATARLHAEELLLGAGPHRVPTTRR
jgi:DNA repair protein RecN (Recombination protein N)